MAWFGRRLEQDRLEATIAFEEFSAQWFALLEKSVGLYPLDSDCPLSYLEIS
ncbi:hypothetical protein [Streptococcus sp. LYSM12]|uniref:hypothetical protein n=1 Tax=Streptococcus sp. LYSM12 TaxID=2558276 RepID=UPI00143035A8|nr:hypothetical protein [Streptococcus sp. LYSM12]